MVLQICTMSITVQTSPAAVSPAKSPVVYKLNTDSMYDTIGRVAKRGIMATAQITVGQKFTLEFAGQSLEFTCVASYTGTGLEFLSDTTAQLQAIAIVEGLKRNYYLFINYTIEYSNAGGHICKITSKEESSNWSLTFTNIDCTGLSSPFSETGVTATPKNFYRIFTQLLVEDEIVSTMAIEPDASGDVTIDLSEYLAPHLTPSFNWPQDNVEIIKKLTNFNKSYYLTYAEYYGTTPEVKMLTKGATKKAFPGGISNEKFKEYSIDSTNWLAYSSARKLFLTNKPNTLWVRKDQPEFLYFLNYGINPTIKLNCKIYYEDGTTETFVAATKTGLSQYDVLEIAVTYNILGLAAKAITAGKAITEYRINVLDSLDNVISEKYRFYVETKPVLYDRYFIFRNSLGTYDTWRTTGLGEKTMSFTMQTVKQYVDPSSYTVFTRQKKQAVKQADAKFKVNTGWISDKLRADYLVNELLMSDDVYIVLGGELYPVIINTDESVVYKDDFFNYFFEFECEMSFTDKCYSIPPDLYDMVALAGGSFNRSFSYDFDSITP